MSWGLLRMRYDGLPERCKGVPTYVNENARYRPGAPRKDGDHDPGQFVPSRWLMLTVTPAPGPGPTRYGVKEYHALCESCADLMRVWSIRAGAVGWARG